MTDREDIDVLAAEYVLGTLDKGERAAVAARRAAESELDQAISDWEIELSPFNELVEEEKPSSDLLPRIQERIEDKPSISGLAQNQPDEIHHLRGRVARWRSAAVAGYAIAAGLAGFIMLGESVFPRQEQKFVAVFQKNDQLPAFLLSIDLSTRELTIRPVAAESQPGKTYQLWIKSEKLGPSPQSLGLLGPVSGPTRKRLLKYDSKLLQEATYGISLEPEGGSPTGKPTSPALHGKLHPTAL